MAITIPSVLAQEDVVYICLAVGIKWRYAVNGSKTQLCMFIPRSPLVEIEYTVFGSGVDSITMGERVFLDDWVDVFCFWWAPFRLQCPPFLSGACPSDGMDSRKALAYGLFSILS